MNGLGYRQRAILAALEKADRPMPFGYLCRACSPGAPITYTSVSLHLLRDRGLVHTGPSRMVDARPRVLDERAAA